MSVELKAALRNVLGTRAVRRLRQSGNIPAVLYGHGQPNIHLSIRMEDLHQVVQHGTKVVELRGDVNESALIREVQWDPFGSEVLHIDLFRVSAGERVETTLPIVLKGEAPGAKAGGMVEHVLHEVDLECPVSSLPDRLELVINQLELGGAIFARELPLPEGAKLLSDPDQIVVHCVEPAGEEVAAEAPEGAAEPEVIGRKAEEEEGEAE